MFHHFQQTNIEQANGEVLKIIQSTLALTGTKAAAKRVIFAHSKSQTSHTEQGNQFLLRKWIMAVAYLRHETQNYKLLVLFHCSFLWLFDTLVEQSRWIFDNLVWPQNIMSNLGRDYVQNLPQSLPQKLYSKTPGFTLAVKCCHWQHMRNIIGANVT